MKDWHVAALAAAVWTGALTARSAPLVVLGLALVIGVVARRPEVLIVGCFLLASGLGARSNHDYRPLQPARFDGQVRVLTDFELGSFGARAEGRLADGKRVVIVANGAVGYDLASVTAGRDLTVTGSVAPVVASDWQRSRHLVGQLHIEMVERVSPIRWWHLPSDALRRRVGAGSQLLAEDARPLYLGLVIGDDRSQTLAQQARFRTAGLSHLLAVSGQNVAFVLAIVRPLLARLGATARLLAIVALLLVFAVATRLEPSVIRATVTAGIATFAAFSGRQSTGLRNLAIAVSGLVLIDPFLVHSVGFQLSVLASTGILVSSVRLTNSLASLPHMPQWLAEAGAVTLSAQLFVLPVLLATFGPVSLVSLPANVLAGWAAGLVMVWGCSVGLVVDSIPLVGEWVQLPAAWAVWWIDTVATWSSRMPAPRLGSFASTGLLTAAFMACWFTARHRRVRTVAVVAIGAILAALVPHAPSGRLDLAGGGVVWIGGDVSVLVVDASPDRRLPGELLAAGVVSIDVVILERGDRSVRTVVEGVIELLEPDLVLAPPLHQIVGARRVIDPVRLDTGTVVLGVAPTDNRLLVSEG